MVEQPSFTRREVNKALLTTAFGLVFARKGAASIAPREPVVLFHFAIAGGYYHGLEAARPMLMPGVSLRLRREPHNPHDADAIAVHMNDGLMLGYIPRAANTPVARLLDDGEVVRAEVVRMLTLKRSEDLPGDLVFTSVMSGDPMIRLTV